MRAEWMASYCVLMLPMALFGQANPKAGPDVANPLQGAWSAGGEVSNRLLTRLVVARDGRGWSVEVWATRGLKDEMVQSVPLTLLRGGVGGTGPVNGGLAVWTEGVGDGAATMYALLRIQEGTPTLELSKVYAQPRYASWLISTRLTKAKS